MTGAVQKCEGELHIAFFVLVYLSKSTQSISLERIDCICFIFLGWQEQLRSVGGGEFHFPLSLFSKSQLQHRPHLFHQDVEMLKRFSLVYLLIFSFYPFRTTYSRKCPFQISDHHSEFKRLRAKRHCWKELNFVKIMVLIICWSDWKESADESRLWTFPKHYAMHKILSMNVWWQGIEKCNEHSAFSFHTT